VSSQAANIVWVSFHSAQDGSPSAAAAATNFVQAPDIGYTSLLAANGHTVTRFGTKNDPTPADAAFLNGFDLIIIGRSVDSANYNEERSFWNSTITKPVINMSGYTLRNNRLGFTAGATIPDTTATIGLEALVPSHPIFSGVALDGANIMVNSFAGIATHPSNGITKRGISVNTDALVGGGTVLGRISATGVPANGMVIGEWQAGATLGTNVLAGHRLVFLSGSREHAGLTSQGAGIYDLVGDGPAMFLNAVTYMAVVPEPSTYALLGIGALALLMRWRKS
jgi:hypothetical protein